MDTMPPLPPALSSFADPFIIGILLVLALGILVPIPSWAISGLEVIGTFAVVVLFFRKGIMGDKELPDLLKKRQKKATKEAVQP